MINARGTMCSPQANNKAMEISHPPLSRVSMATDWTLAVFAPGGDSRDYVILDETAQVYVSCNAPEIAVAHFAVSAELCIEQENPRASLESTSKSVVWLSSQPSFTVDPQTQRPTWQFSVPVSAWEIQPHSSLKIVAYVQDLHELQNQDSSAAHVVDYVSESLDQVNLLQDLGEDVAFPATQLADFVYRPSVLTQKTKHPILQKALRVLNPFHDVSVQGYFPGGPDVSSQLGLVFSLSAENAPVTIENTRITVNSPENELEASEVSAGEPFPVVLAPSDQYTFLWFFNYLGNALQNIFDPASMQRSAATLSALESVAAVVIQMDYTFKGVSISSSWACHLDISELIHSKLLSMAGALFSSSRLNPKDDATRHFVSGMPSFAMSNLFQSTPLGGDIESLLASASSRKKQHANTLLAFQRLSLVRLVSGAIASQILRIDPREKPIEQDAILSAPIAWNKVVQSGISKQATRPKSSKHPDILVSLNHNAERLVAAANSQLTIQVALMNMTTETKDVSLHVFPAEETPLGVVPLELQFSHKIKPYETQFVNVPYFALIPGVHPLGVFRVHEQGKDLYDLDSSLVIDVS